MTGLTPLDPAKIMREHRSHRGICLGCLRGGFVSTAHPCDVFRLAKALAAAEAALTAERVRVADAYRDGGRAALRKFRDEFDAFDHPYDNAIVAALADEHADGFRAALADSADEVQP